jgi:hypothetical protein
MSNSWLGGGFAALLAACTLLPSEAPAGSDSEPGAISA